MMKLDLTSLRKSIHSLEAALDFACSHEQLRGLSEAQKDVVRAGVIQNFEFTYELCWKFMKRWLDHNLGSAYVDGVPRKELFRLAVEHQLISNVNRWFTYHDARNETPTPMIMRKPKRSLRPLRNFCLTRWNSYRDLESKNA